MSDPLLGAHFQVPTWVEPPVLRALADPPGLFLTRLTTTALQQPSLLAVSQYTAQFPALTGLSCPGSFAAQFWSGSQKGSGLEGFAMVYSGHQFGVWAGQLGDGRAITLGALADRSGQLHEVQLKGSGLTPYSRMADGRAVLRSSLREYLASEAMASLGIPTTRAFTLVQAVDPVFRETVENAAVVSRVAPSFIRFGHFEHFYYQNQHDELRRLFDFVQSQYFPEAGAASNPAAEVLKTITERSAELVAQWQAVGFCHGVLNTDNMSILGLTIDYGPFGFMEAFEPGFICNHSDHQGRYSYENQPGIVQWNCYALGQTFVPLIGSADETKSVLSVFKPTYEAAMHTLWRKKLGLASEDNPLDRELADRFLSLMASNHADWTLTWRALGYFDPAVSSSAGKLLDLMIDREATQQWLNDYQMRLEQIGRPTRERQTQQQLVNPKYVLRNYLAQQAIQEAQDLKGQAPPEAWWESSHLARLQACLAKPYDEQPEFDDYARLPPDWARHIEVSCSS